MNDTPSHGPVKYIMPKWVRGPQDFVGGIALIAIALFALWASSDLQGMHGFSFGAGTAPRMFAVLLLGLGIAVTVVGLVTEGAHLATYAWRGAVVGTLVGVLPGIGTIATVAMLLPITFGLPPVGALIMLAGIYYGAQYGGSTTSILVNIPGEATSVVTTLDGFQMAKQGRAGPALAIAAIGSFFAGCVSTVLIAVLGAPLTKLALAFGPAEYFSLMVLGLIFAT